MQLTSATKKSDKSDTVLYTKIFSVTRGAFTIIVGLLSCVRILLWKSSWRGLSLADSPQWKCFLWPLLFCVFNKLLSLSCTTSKIQSKGNILVSLQNNPLYLSFKDTYVLQLESYIKKTLNFFKAINFPKPSGIRKEYFNASVTSLMKSKLQCLLLQLPQRQ